MPDELLVERKGSTYLLTLNHPEARNAIDAELLGALTRVLRELPKTIHDEGLDSLVITGAGGTFCAGADLKDPTLRRSAPTSILRFDYNPVIVMLRNLSVPIVTAVNGPAIGIGMALALLVDISYATRDAYF